MTKSKGPKENLTKEQAVNLFNSNFWETMTHRERAVFQMNEGRLCMPFEVFQEAITKTLNRHVFTHEFGLNYDGLLKELMGNAPTPTFKQIVNMIPKDKRCLIVV